MHHIVNPNLEQNSLNNNVQYNQTPKLHLFYISTLTTSSSSSTTRAPSWVFKHDHNQLWLDNSDIFQDQITMTLGTTSLGEIQVSLAMNKSHEFLLL